MSVVKSEAPKPKAERNPKLEIRRSLAALQYLGLFKTHPTLVRISKFGLLSDFGFRVSGFEAGVHSVMALCIVRIGALQSQHTARVCNTLFDVALLQTKLLFG